ncbi:MAG: hypothetical protein KDA21_11115 [Phycisphaerales bacterium]|nr:hypothetical protein [Phycisphaerales bacterium]
MRRRPLLFAFLTFLLLVVLAAAVMWRLLTPSLGRPLDIRPEIRQLQFASRPSPDTPDGWDALVACLVELHLASITTADDPPDDLPDFGRLYAPDVEVDEWESLTNQVRHLSSAALFHLLLETDDQATEKEINHAREAFAALHTPRFTALLDDLGAQSWMAATLMPDDATVLLPYLSDVRSLGLVLRAMINEAWMEDNLDTVRRCVRAHAALARLMMTQSTLVEHGVGISLASELINRLEALDGEYGVPPEWATPLSDDLGPLDDLLTWHHCLEFDRLYVLYAISCSYSGTRGGNGRYLPVQAAHLGEGREPPEPYTINDRFEDIDGFKAPSRRELERLVNQYHDDIEALPDATPDAIVAIQARTIARLNDLAPNHGDLHFAGYGSFSGCFSQPVGKLEERLSELQHARDALKSRLGAPQSQQ